jgi:1-acyl-sn-glycerol-3-phosphate acyltransferase
MTLTTSDRILRDREPFVSLAFYHLFKWSIVSPMLHLYFQGRIYGADRVPTQGPLIVVSNHASDFDPPILSCCVRRPVAFMAKESLFQVPGLSQAIQLYGAYPVRRGASDRKALQLAMSYLESGWAAGIFLGGTRTANARIDDPKQGAAWISAMLQVPLLPVSLYGTERILTKGRSLPNRVPVTVRIGEPIPPPASTDRSLLMATTAKCRDVIHQLHDLGR